METKSSVECWQRLHEVIEEKGRGLEREQQWWMEVRQKAIKDSLQLLLEQHSPLLRALLDTGDAMLVHIILLSKNRITPDFIEDKRISTAFFQEMNKYYWRFSRSL